MASRRRPVQVIAETKIQSEFWRDLPVILDPGSIVVLRVIREKLVLHGNAVRLPD